MAKAIGCNVSGLELTKERPDSARIKGINVLSWEEIPSCKFDFINTEQVFEHLADSLKTLIYLVRALNPNGVLKISVSTAKNIGEILKKNGMVCSKIFKTFSQTSSSFRA